MEPGLTGRDNGVTSGPVFLSFWMTFPEAVVGEMKGKAKKERNKEEIEGIARHGVRNM